MVGAGRQRMRRLPAWVRGLRERLLALGGDVGLEERVGGGAQLRACLPLLRRAAR